MIVLSSRSCFHYDIPCGFTSIHTFSHTGHSFSAVAGLPNPLFHDVDVLSIPVIVDPLVGICSLGDEVFPTGGQSLRLVPFKLLPTVHDKSALDVALERGAYFIQAS